MISREGALALISLSGWTIFIASLLYQPFLFLVSIFLQIFFSTYMLLAFRRLQRLDVTGLKVERIFEPINKYGKNILKTETHLSTKGKTPLYIQAIDEPPYGTRVVDGSAKAEGLVGPKRDINFSYTLEVEDSIGLVRFSKLTVRVYDPLKLCYVTREIAAPSELILPVGEQLTGASYAKLRALWPRPPSGLGFKGLVGYDDEFMGIKAYDEGDRLRDIHWLRYARLVDEDEIIAKKYSKKGEVALHIVVDCSPAINTGPKADLIQDTAMFLRRLCLTAEEEGNSIHFWLINPALSLEERYSPRGTISRTAIEQYLAKIFPAIGRDDGKMAELFERHVKPASMTVFIVNPPSENIETIEKMVDACKKAGARYVLCLPEMSSYISEARTEIGQLLDVDRVYKERWLSKVADAGSVVFLRKETSADIAREIIRRGGEWTLAG